MRQDGTVTQPVGDAPHDPSRPEQSTQASPPAPGFHAAPEDQGWASGSAFPLAATATTESTAVVGLICAILSWLVLPVVLAVVALVLARSAERSIHASAGRKTGLSLVTGARWIAWIHLLVVAMIVAFAAAFVLAIAIAR